MSEERDLRLAVLIDADNAPRSALGDVMAEVAVYGTPTIKRIYGDWTTPNLASWKPLLLENAITPVQQYGYTTGKNSTDSAMIIDAMDILYTGQVDGFVLVSSDSDFTRLAIRLREAGKKVYGMGEKKTPNPFIDACDKFVYIEVIRSAAQQERAEEAAREEPKEPPKRHGARPKRRGRGRPAPAPEAEPPSRVPKEIITLLADSVEMLADEDGYAPLGEVANLLVRKKRELRPPQLRLLQAEQAGQGPAPVRGGRPPGRPVQHEALLCPGQGAEIAEERAGGALFFLDKVMRQL